MSFTATDSLVLDSLARGLHAGALVALAFTLLVFVKSLFDFTRTGPQMTDEVLSHYRLYLAWSLGRLAFYAFLVSFFMASVGIVAYVIVLIVFGGEFRILPASTAALVAILALRARRFVHTLLHSPGVIAASSLYTTTHLYPLWDRLTPTRLRRLDAGALVALTAWLAANMSSQYSLPCTLPVLGRADRTLEGVRKCLLHAVHQAQGQGGSVGALGVCIGGDRASGYQFAKEQFFRPLDDRNPDPLLAELEEHLVRDANRLGIGTMGFGGQVSLIGCKVGTLNRLPASFFVTVDYCCWALRRLGVVLDAGTGAIKHWLYRDETEAVLMARAEGLPVTGRELRLAIESNHRTATLF